MCVIFGTLMLDALFLESPKCLPEDDGYPDCAAYEEEQDRLQKIDDCLGEANCFHETDCNAGMVRRRPRPPRERSPHDVSLLASLHGAARPP